VGNGCGQCGSKCTGCWLVAGWLLAGWLLAAGDRILGFVAFVPLCWLSCASLIWNSGYPGGTLPKPKGPGPWGASGRSRNLLAVADLPVKLARARLLLIQLLIPSPPRAARGTLTFLKGDRPPSLQEVKLGKSTSTVASPA
jgi:hypothetical protein